MTDNFPSSINKLARIDPDPSKDGKDCAAVYVLGPALRDAFPHAVCEFSVHRVQSTFSVKLNGEVIANADSVQQAVEAIRTRFPAEHKRLVGPVEIKIRGHTVRQ